jgi:outer membrane receptor protein involved in Fe transport
VVAQAAGAANESQAGGISIDGSSGSENRFIIDGIDTTSPQVGTNAVPMRAEFMEEVQVKSAGYAAEFGGSTGGVINAITRSGTNQFQRRDPVGLPDAEVGR